MILRCMDCFSLTDRVPSTCICSQCYDRRKARDRQVVEKILNGERSRAIALKNVRDRELRLVDRLEREWTPPLAEILKETG